MKARRVKKLDPGSPLVDNAARIIRVRLDEMLSFAPAALEFERIRDQHDMRIAAKRLRYILETTEFCFGKPAQSARRRARDLQDLLGELHDCDVMLPRVEAHLAALRAEDAAARAGARRRLARPRSAAGRARAASDRLPWPRGARGLRPGAAQAALRPLPRVLGGAGARRHLEASGADGRPSPAGCEGAPQGGPASGAGAPRARGGGAQRARGRVARRQRRRRAAGGAPRGSREAAAGRGTRSPGRSLLDRRGRPTIARSSQRTSVPSASRALARPQRGRPHRVASSGRSRSAT